MDRLRVLQYFVAAARARSFSGAARALDVSAQAVIKGITALERDLGNTLFERSPRGLALTAGGTAYLDACAPALAMLEDAHARARAATREPTGTVVVVATNVLAREVLARALPRFHTQYPRVQIDLRDNRGERLDDSGESVDVFVTMGWSTRKDLVRREVARTRLWVVATPEYWARHGAPDTPHDLVRHSCLTVRNTEGAVMDLWEFTRGGERVAVAVNGWFIASNGHRDVAIDLLLAGAGVMRSGDWAFRELVASGRLVRVLADWEAAERPPVCLSYPPSVRRVPRVRAFLDFAEAALGEIDAARDQPVRATGAPEWFRRGYPRASALVARQPR